MKKSFISKFIRVFLWKLMGIGTGLISMFIVMPRLSHDTSSFGIYSLCLSFSMFLSYADIGFLSAGQKYASEAYARNDDMEELRLMGFVHFILGLFVLLFALLMFYFSLDVNTLVKTTDEQGKHLARQLLVILALFSPVFLLQRLAQSIFGIRIEDYYYQGVDFFYNLIKIGSSFYFFSDDKYDLIGYYFVFNICSLLSVLTCFYVIRRRYSYSFIHLLRSLRFSREIFNRIKPLAFSSMVVTLLWVLYFEMDLLIINRFFTVQDVAYYSVVFSLLNFIRSIYGTFFSPFLVRMNHHLGAGNKERAKSFIMEIILLTMPIAILPFTVLFWWLPGIISFWVGDTYASSVALGRILLFMVIFYPLVSPMSYLVIAFEKFNVMNITSIVLLVSFYTSFILSYHSIGLIALPISKVGAYLLYVVILIILTKKVLQPESVIRMLGSLVKPLTASILLLILIMTVYDSLTVNIVISKNIHFGMNLVVYGAALLLSLASYYLLNNKAMEMIRGLLRNLNHDSWVKKTN